MSESLRDLLAKGADTVDQPHLDVDRLVAQAERRLVRRRVGVLAASAAAVAVVTAGGLALQTQDQSSPPPPPADTTTPDVDPALGPAIYFDALAVDGDELTDRSYSFGGRKDIYLVRPGGPTQQIIATDADEHCPRVSPDGGMLAYLEGRKTVVLRGLDATGHPDTAPVRVGFTADQGVTCPQWSPDGRRLAVGVQNFEAPNQVFEVQVIELDGTERLLATQRDQYMPLSEIAWSPDGDEIAFTTPDSVWVAPLDGREAEMVWRGRAPQDPTGPPPPGTIGELSWLATGELAVGTLVRYTDVGQDVTLHIVDPDSGREQALGTFPTGEPTTWSWSPDGSKFVFADFDGGPRLFDRATGKTMPVRPRLDGRDLWISTPVWSPEGDRLVGTAGDGDPSTVVFALVSMDPDGSSVEVLTPWVLALYSTADVSWSSR